MRLELSELGELTGPRRLVGKSLQSAPLGPDMEFLQQVLRQDSLQTSGPPPQSSLAQPSPAQPSVTCKAHAPTWKLLKYRPPTGERALIPGVLASPHPLLLEFPAASPEPPTTTTTTTSPPCREYTTQSPPPDNRRHIRSPLPTAQISSSLGPSLTAHVDQGAHSVRVTQALTAGAILHALTPTSRASLVVGVSWSLSTSKNVANPYSPRF